MFRRYRLILPLVCLALLFAACNDDDDPSASIVGNWTGDRAEFRYNLIPITEDDFDLALEFKSDGTMTATDDGQTVSGTYQVSGDILTITGISIASIPVSLSGDYEIENLTNDELELQAEREGQYVDPNLGTISGTVRANLKFRRAN